MTTPFADRSFGVIVVKRHVLMIQKHQQFLATPLRTFDQTFRFNVFPFVRNQTGQSIFNGLAQSFVLRNFQRLSLATQSHRTTKDSLQTLRKHRTLCKSQFFCDSAELLYNHLRFDLQQVFVDVLQQGNVGNNFAVFDDRQSVFGRFGDPGTVATSRIA